MKALIFIVDKKSVTICVKKLVILKILLKV